MSFFFDWDDGIKLEVTDDGALVFLNYDVEHDVVLAEMGEEVTRPVILLEDWQERPIPTLFQLQTNVGVRYDSSLYDTIAKKWILDTASFLNKNKFIGKDLEKTVIKYVKEGDFEHRFEDVFIKGHIERHGMRQVFWSGALSDAINKYAKVSKSDFYFNDFLTIKFDIERTLSFYSSPESWEKKQKFKHEMLLTVIQAMKAY